ncbi:MAG: UDP-N-acetylenolpyruvoylglucosamine reductase, partial [Rikenellaceae bacterium]
DVEREVDSRCGATLENIRNSVIAIRQSKLPDTAELGNAGSFFKNPVVAKQKVESLLESYENMPHYNTDKDSYIKLAAGWLIEKAGLKGVRQGSVGVHARQALVLVNYGGATGKEIITFAEHIRSTVQKQFGVNLEFEINIVG